MAVKTKDRILDAAEQLFADHGFPATSLRDITNEADVNLAAVNYHFGSKEALLIAVLERTTIPVNRDRLKRLDQLEAAAAGRPIEPEQLVRAFLTPLFEQRSNWAEQSFSWLKLMGRIHTEVDQQLRARLMEQYETALSRFSAALRHSLPHLKQTEMIWRGLFMIGSMSFTLTWGASILASDKRARQTPIEILEELIRFTAAGMAAPTGKSRK